MFDVSFSCPGCVELYTDTDTDCKILYMEDTAGDEINDSSNMLVNWAIMNIWALYETAYFSSTTLHHYYTKTLSDFHCSLETAKLYMRTQMSD